MLIRLEPKLNIIMTCSCPTLHILFHALLHRIFYFQIRSTLDSSKIIKKNSKLIEKNTLISNGINENRRVVKINILYHLRSINFSEYSCFHIETSKQETKAFINPPRACTILGIYIFRSFFAMTDFAMEGSISPYILMHNRNIFHCSLINLITYLLFFKFSAPFKYFNYRFPLISA